MKRYRNLSKKKIKNMNDKMTQTHDYQQMNLKEKKNNENKN